MNIGIRLVGIIMIISLVMISCTQKNNIVGTIVSPHGNKGLVRVRFRRGLPGQALGTTVKIVG